jgi:hypothetical protein
MITLSLSLSLLHKKHLTNLIVGGGSAGQPPAGLSCFAGQDTDEGMSLMSPRHRTKNYINNTKYYYQSIIINMQYYIYLASITICLYIYI